MHKYLCGVKHTAGYTDNWGRLKKQRVVCWLLSVDPFGTFIWEFCWEYCLIECFCLFVCLSSPHVTPSLLRTRAAENWTVTILLPVQIVSETNSTAMNMQMPSHAHVHRGFWSHTCCALLMVISPFQDQHTLARRSHVLLSAARFLKQKSDISVSCTLMHTWQASPDKLITY